MTEIRAIFGDDDRENEEFLGFDLDNIEEAEERYTSIQQLDVLNDFDSDIEFSEMGLSNKEEIDSEEDTVLAGIAKWSDPLRPIQIAEFTGPTTVMENNKREIDFFNLLFPEALSVEIATQTNEYARKHIEATPTKIGTQPIQRNSRLLLVFKLSWVFYQPLPKTCTGTKINCSIHHVLK